MLYILLGALPVAAVAVFTAAFARGNYLAYALAAWTLALRAPTGELFGQGDAALMIQGGLVAIVLAATLIWAFLPVLRGAPSGLKAEA